MRDISALFTLIPAAAVALTGCDDSMTGSLPQSAVEVQLTLPVNVEADDVRDGRFSFLNINTGATDTFLQGETIFLLPGLYDVSYSADVTLPNGVTSQLKALRQSVTLGEGENRIILSPYLNITGDDFIISEIFFTGTLQGSGNQYNGDDYIKIYNNTDHVLYADGLTLFESKFTTTQKLDYTPSIMGEAMTVDALYTIPGSGKEHPVNPGEYLLIADTGIDHRVINPNSFDLSHADWEWYDVSTQPSQLDIDSPTVENLDKWYCYTQSIFVLHNQGLKAYGLARIPIDSQTYIKDYYYTYDYTLVTQAGSFPMNQSAYRLPNEWIVDVVNCSARSTYQWNVSAPVLDMGWTWCSQIEHDKERYFKAVRRKMIALSPEGYPILQDTNNSSEDFNACVTPSEIELQGTATDVNGTPCTVITYDGITPVE
jgi:hypothetical protein